jgi:hypothetical protein
MRDFLGFITRPHTTSKFQHITELHSAILPAAKQPLMKAGFGRLLLVTTVGFLAGYSTPRPSADGTLLPVAKCRFLAAKIKIGELPLYACHFTTLTCGSRPQPVSQPCKFAA